MFAASEGSYRQVRRGHRERLKMKIRKLFFDFSFPSVTTVSSVAKKLFGVIRVNDR